MSGYQTIESTDASDPLVTHWLLECGFLTAPVKFRLRATSMEDLKTEIDRLLKLFGDEVRITAEEHNRVGNEYIAYGAFLR
jgi:hypothetical protein